MGIKYKHGGQFKEWPNGTREFRTADPYATLAKVENVLCDDGKRRNAFATAYPDTFFTIPACVYVGKKTVAGILTRDEDGWKFTVLRSGKNAALIPEQQ